MNSYCGASILEPVLQVIVHLHMMATPDAIRELDQAYRLAKYLESPGEYLDPRTHAHYEPFGGLPMPPKRPLSKDERTVMVAERAAEARAREEASRERQASRPTLREYLKEKMEIRGIPWDDAEMTFTSEELDMKEIVFGSVCTNDGVFTVMPDEIHDDGYIDLRWLPFLR